MTTSPELIVAGATGLSVLLIGQYRLRNELSDVKSWIWGYPHANGSGADDRQESLDERIGTLQQTVENISTKQDKARVELMNEVQSNREAVDAIADVIDREEDLSDVDIKTRIEETYYNDDK